MLRLVLRLLCSPRGLIGLGGAAIIAVLLVQTARPNPGRAPFSHPRRSSMDGATGQTGRDEAEARARPAATLTTALDEQSRGLNRLRAVQARAAAASASAVAAARVLGARDRE